MAGPESVLSTSEGTPVEDGELGARHGEGQGTAIAAIGGVALAGAAWVVACARRMALPRGIVRVG